MNNKVIIDVDDDRDRSVLLDKPEDFTPPQDDEGARNMMKVDLETICEGLMSLMSTCDKYNIFDKEKTIKYVITHLLTKFPQTKYREQLGEILEDKNSIKARKKRLKKKITRDSPKRSRTLKKIS